MAFLECTSNCGWKWGVKDCKAKKECICKNCLPLQGMGSAGILQYDVCVAQCMNSDPLLRPQSVEQYVKGMNKQSGDQKAEKEAVLSSLKNAAMYLGLGLAAIVIGAIIYFTTKK